MQLLRTLEYVFHGRAILFLAFKYSNSLEELVFGLDLFLLSVDFSAFWQQKHSLLFGGHSYRMSVQA